MSLTQRLNEDLKQALRSGDEVRKSTVRMLMSALKNQQIENRAPLDDQQELSVVQREVKVRRESAEEYGRIGRQELVEQQLAELSVLQGYLPEQMPDEELRALVEEAVRDTGATSPREMGKVMSALLPRVRGRAEGKKVSDMVRQVLSGGS